MELKTARLLLREIAMNDLAQVHDLHSFPEVDRYNTMGIPADLAITRNHIAGWLKLRAEVPAQKYVFRINDQHEEFIGLTGVNIGKPNYRQAEIWYKLHPAHWSKGYATEAVNGILEFCFTTLHLHRVAAGCATENTASIKVLEKAGFVQEGLHRKNLPIRGEWLDNFDYAILEEDFF